MEVRCVAHATRRDITQFMLMAAYISLIAIAVLVALVVTGWWRLGLVVFRIKPANMTVARLGLLVGDGDVERIDTLLASFTDGFNTAISARTLASVRRRCDGRPVLYRPFAHEGLAMGYTLRRMFRYQPADFEDRIVCVRPEFRYLYYVGLGFWSGMRNHSPGRLARVVRGLDPVLSPLCYDGYGFKRAFFDYPKNPDVFSALDELEGFARNAAYQGVGRALVFRFLDRPDVLIEHVDRLGDCAPDAAAGVGLAIAFIFADQLQRARELAIRLPDHWHDHVHLGMCFGLNARAMNDAERFRRNVRIMPEPVQEAIFASVRECDRMELLVRADNKEDGYRRWRDGVREWMTGHIAYPLAEVTAPSPAADPRAIASTKTGGRVL